MGSFWSQTAKCFRSADAILLAQARIRRVEVPTTSLLKHKIRTRHNPYSRDYKFNFEHCFPDFAWKIGSAPSSSCQKENQKRCCLWEKGPSRTRQESPDWTVASWNLPKKTKNYKLKWKCQNPGKNLVNIIYFIHNQEKVLLLWKKNPVGSPWLILGASHYNMTLGVCLVLLGQKRTRRVQKGFHEM